MDQSSEPTPQRGGTMAIGKFLKVFFFIWFFGFAIIEIEEYLHIYDAYPFAWDVLNSTVCIVLGMLYNNYT